MCVIAAKYFDGVGFILAKNRDRNYIPTIRIVQSNRRGIQRLYIDDKTTRYTEGLNEYGLSIVSAALAVKTDEKEAEKTNPSAGEAENFMSPDGKKIRTALFEKSPEAALKKLIELKLNGHTLIANEKSCYLLEAGVDIETEEYFHRAKEISKKDGMIVRTNHGILLPDFGYDEESDDADERKSAKSSNVRYQIAKRGVEKAKAPLDMLEALSSKENDDPLMNPIRFGDITKGEMVTTGQLLLFPRERSMHYRPIHSNIEFEFTKLNRRDSKTFFEIVSNRRLLGFKEFLEKDSS